jgi:hypothetical protein
MSDLLGSDGYGRVKYWVVKYWIAATNEVKVCRLKPWPTLNACDCGVTWPYDAFILMTPPDDEENAYSLTPF